MQATKPIKIAIVDDHQIVIDGIKALLNTSPHFVIVSDTTSPVALLNALRFTDVDILITDIMMPEMNGSVLAKKVKENYPSIKIHALSMSGEGHVVNEMINEADISITIDDFSNVFWIMTFVYCRHLILQNFLLVIPAVMPTLIFSANADSMYLSV